MQSSKMKAEYQKSKQGFLLAGFFTKVFGYGKLAVRSSVI
jgi:hypothetical protein